MGLFNSIRMGASGAEPSYTIDRSLRFNDGDSPYFECFGHGLLLVRLSKLHKLLP